MRSETIIFGPWLPDLPPASHQGMVEAWNVIGRAEGYVPLAELNLLSTALPGACRGAVGLFDKSGNAHLFAATASKLYKLNGTSWDEVTRSSGDYATGAEERWVFAHYGNRVLASNFSDEIQSFMLGSDTEFSDLDVSAPRARSLAIINNFVVAGLTAQDEAEVRWSALDDPEDWVVDVTTQSDAQVIENEGGAVQAIIGEQNGGIILQERALVRMEYVGPPQIFTFTEIMRGRGAMCSGGVASVGGRVFFLSEDGFYTLGQEGVVPIGHGRVNRWFFQQVDQQYLHRITAVADPIAGVVVWSFPDVNAASGLPNHLLIYHYLDDRWSHAEQEAELVFQGLTPGRSLEDLDNVAATLEALPFGLDSRLWKGGALTLAAFSGDHRLGFFSGEPRAARLATAEVMLNPEGRAMVTAVYPITDAENVEIRVGGRARLANAQAFSPWVASEAGDQAHHVVVDARWHQAEIALQGAWTQAQGLQLDVQLRGRR
jgi:hypothetical protein